MRWLSSLSSHTPYFSQTDKLKQKRKKRKKKKDNKNNNIILKLKSSSKRSPRRQLEELRSSLEASLEMWRWEEEDREPPQHRCRSRPGAAPDVGVDLRS